MSTFVIFWSEMSDSFLVKIFTYLPIFKSFTDSQEILKAITFTNNINI